MIKFFKPSSEDCGFESKPKCIPIIKCTSFCVGYLVANKLKLKANGQSWDLYLNAFWAMYFVIVIECILNVFDQTLQKAKLIVDLPVPVAAQAQTSLPNKATGIVEHWIGVG